MSIESILVVCVGNICRSPMAQALLKESLPELKIESAGVGALVGEPADALAQQLMTDRGIDISSHRAQQVSLGICLRADLILVMDQMQRRHLESQYPQVKGKVFRLGELAKQDVPDPYRKSKEFFAHSLALIEVGANAWVDRIQKI